MKDINALIDTLKAAPSRKVIITTHHKPDADAMGSSLGLWNFLKDQGYDAQVITPTDYGRFLFWMPGNEQVLIYEGNEKKAEELVTAADVVFCLDFNGLKRINELGEVVARSKAIKVMIDHHLEPENFDDYRLWTTQTSSTSELIHDFILLWVGKEALTKDIASCLYAGIMADTGSFRHNSTRAQTHRVAANLIDAGAENSKIHSLILDSFSLTRTRFIGYCLYEKLQLIPGLPVAWISLNREELKRFDIKTGDTEGLVNYGLSIEGVQLAVLIIDRTVRVKMSFRSKDKFPCNAFAKEFFNGGGHFNAAGGESELSLEETIERFQQAIWKYEAFLR